MDKLREYLNKEKCFSSFKEALYYAVLVQKEKNEDLAVFKATDNLFYTVQAKNAEIAIRLGYEPVVGLTEILFVAESADEPERALENYYKRITENK